MLRAWRAHDLTQRAADGFDRRRELPDLHGRHAGRKHGACGAQRRVFGEVRIIDLPRLPQQAVALAGICCVDDRFRRRGLFRELEQRAFRAAGIASPRVLSCGRVAHPASFRTMTWHPSHVPKRGTPPTNWQREIGAAVAAAYGVNQFDPQTFVCAGGGAPMIPIIDIDVKAEEWEVFAAIDRQRGDALLGLCWMPDAPEGW